MTKKDYIAIAIALRDLPRTSNKVELTDVVRAVSEVFRSDNAKFDGDLFKDAVFGNYAGMAGLRRK